MIFALFFLVAIAGIFVGDYLGRKGLVAKIKAEIASIEAASKNEETLVAVKIASAIASIKKHL